MSTATRVERQDGGSAGVLWREPGGRAQQSARGRDAGIPPGVEGTPREVRELLADVVVDELLAGAHGGERSSDRAGCFRS
jgi:hypothetical protein